MYHCDYKHHHFFIFSLLVKKLVFALYLVYMYIKSKNLLLMLLTLLISGCVFKHNRSLYVPSDKYVKVFHRVDILSCKKDSKNCSKGSFQTTGSGMLISLNTKYGKGFILTAGHVCDSILPNSVSNSLQFNQVMDEHGALHNAHVIISSQKTNDGSDLCIMYSPTFDKRGVDISSIEPKIGDQIYYIGSPAGVYHPPVAPVLTGIYSGIIDNSSAMITAPGVGGSSGSAILNSRGRIVGVLWAAHPTFHHVSLMSNFKSFKKFLKSARETINSF